MTTTTAMKMKKLYRPGCTPRQPVAGPPVSRLSKWQPSSHPAASSQQPPSSQQNDSPPQLELPRQSPVAVLQPPSMSMLCSIESTASYLPVPVAGITSGGRVGTNFQRQPSLSSSGHTPACTLHLQRARHGGHGRHSIREQRGLLGGGGGGGPRPPPPVPRPNFVTSLRRVGGIHCCCQYVLPGELYIQSVDPRRALHPERRSSPWLSTLRPPATAARMCCWQVKRGAGRALSMRLAYLGR